MTYSASLWRRWRRIAIQVVMRTCRDLYREGPRLLLAMAIRLRTPAQYASYVAFLGAPASERTPLVRSLFLGRPDNVSADVVRQIAGLIRAMSNLERLYLADINIYPDLSAAIATRSSVKHLTLAEDGRDMYSLVRDMPSRLLTLRLPEFYIHSGLSLLVGSRL
ncbi:hypothetical protein VTO73DRAFT_29 [Trametes versicolor]